MSVDSIIELAVEVGSDVITEAGSDFFGDIFLSGLDNADALLGETLSGVWDQAGSLAGSGSFWDTFNPGDIYDNITGSITDFFSPNAGELLTQQFAGQSGGTGFGGLLNDAYTSVTDFFSVNPGELLTQQFGGQSGGTSVGGLLNNTFQTLTGSSANLVNPDTFNLNSLLLKTAQQVAPSLITSFIPGPLGQVAGNLVKTGLNAVSPLVNPQVLGPNAGPQLPNSSAGGSANSPYTQTSRNERVVQPSPFSPGTDNGYGGGSQAEYDAINYTIQTQQIEDADAGVVQAQDNVAGAERTYRDTVESLSQASSAVEAYDRLLVEPGLSEQEIIDLTAQRDASAAQLAEARYQIDIAQQDLASASDQLANANNQYDQVISSANAQNTSPNLDPYSQQSLEQQGADLLAAYQTNTNTTGSTNDPLSAALARAEAIARGTIPTGGLSANSAVNAVVAALGGNTAAVNQALRILSSPTPVPGQTAAANISLANIIRTATGVDINTDAGLLNTLAQTLTLAGADPNLINAAFRTAEASTTQALTDQLRQQQALREQKQNIARNGDWRVRLRLAEGSNYLYNANGGQNAGILQPLFDTGGVVFPYTPSIDTAYKADYEAYNLTHSNYKGYFYRNSSVEPLNIKAQFTAQDTAEAEYLLAVIHFFRSATKMFYGQDSLRGAPPPLVFLTGYGEYQFSDHPCVISNFNYILPSDVDYIRARSSFTNGTTLLTARNRSTVSSNPFSYALNRLKSVGLTPGALDQRIPPPTLGQDNPTYVPTKMEISITLLPVQTRSQVSKQFSLQNFANGNLLKGGFW
jgi:hypothetical protein